MNSVSSLKRIARNVIRAAIKQAPWGVREAILDASLQNFGLREVSRRLFKELKIVEIAAVGDVGLIRSAWNDNEILFGYARTGTGEKAVVETIRTFLGDATGTYFDVGANIGLTTIPFARNSRIKCVAFEPDPSNFRLLTLNTKTNAPDSSVDFQNIALFDSRRTLTLALADGNLGDHRVTLSSIPGRQTVEIEGRPLDDFVDRINGRFAVKIDTQGAEPFVVAGGRHVLARAGLLAIEFCPYLMRELGGDPHLVVDLLSTFERVAITKPGSDEPARFGPAAAAQDMLRRKLETAADTDGDYVDIIAMRSLPQETQA